MDAGHKVNLQTSIRIEHKQRHAHITFDIHGSSKLVDYFNLEHNDLRFMVAQESMARNLCVP